MAARWGMSSFSGFGVVGPAIVAAAAFVASAAFPPEKVDEEPTYFYSRGRFFPSFEVRISKEQSEAIEAQDELHRETLKTLEARRQEAQSRYDDKLDVLEPEIQEVQSTLELAIDRILTPAQRAELRRQRKEELQREVRELAEFAGGVGSKLGAIVNAEKLVIYEGLPHQKLTELVDAERKAKKTLVLDGFYFYADPITPTPKDTWILRELAAKFETYRPYGGPKFCGGYHPDWCLEWGEGKSVQRLFLCFGCREAKFDGGDKPVMADLRKKSYEAFTDTLTMYRKNLPEQGRAMEKPGDKPK